MKCKQQCCLNPTLPPLKHNTHGLRPRGHSYGLRALSGVYTDAHDDGGVLHCFLFSFFCVIVLVNLCMYVCYML